MRKIDTSKLSGSLSLEVAIAQGKLLDKIFRIKDTEIDSKIFHTWKMAGMLDTLDNGKWANMSFVEYLWLCTLESMRKFGCSHKLMKKIHYELFTKAYEDGLGKKTLRENIAILKKVSMQRPLFVDELHYLSESERLLKDEKLIETLKKDITYFYQLVLKCFNNNNEVGIIIYEDQSFTTYQLTNNVSKSDKVLDLSIPHIKIPLTSFIKKFLDDEQKSKFLKSSGLINDQEIQVLTAIREQNLSSITIQFDAEKNIKKIESTETGFIHGDDAKEIMRLLGMNNYTGIEMHTRDGKTLSYTHTRKNYMAYL
jgi:hypothetical protein